MVITAVQQINILLWANIKNNVSLKKKKKKGLHANSITILHQKCTKIIIIFPNTINCYVQNQLASVMIL